MPKFIQTTDRLLSDPELLRQNQMDIQVIDKTMKEGEDDNNNIDEEIKEPIQYDDNNKLIQMEIGVGVYDIHNENFDEKAFKATSSEPIVRVQGMKEEDAEDNSSNSSDDGSDDSNLYYEFDSDSEIASHTTKSTSTVNKHVGLPMRMPMIIDITPPNMMMETDDDP